MNANGTSEPSSWEVVARAAAFKEQMTRHARRDGYMNFSNAFGTTDDATKNVGFDYSELGYEDLRRLWKGGGLSKRAVEKPAAALYRRGFEVLTGHAGLDQHLQDRITEIGLVNSFRKADEYRYAYGLGGSYLHFSDVDEDSSPSFYTNSNIGNITRLSYPPAPGSKLLWMRPHDSLELFVQGSQWDRNFTSPTYLQPTMWTFRLRTGGIQNVHPSRLIIHTGPVASNWDMWEHLGKGMSTLSQLQEKLADLDGMWRSLLNAAAECSIGVLGIHDLGSLISRDDAADAIARLRNFKKGLSTANIGVIDSERENFQRVNAPFESFPAALLTAMRLVAAWAGIPMSVLFGESPAGLTNTGDDDLRNWYDDLHTDQVVRVEPKVRRVVDYILETEHPQFKGKIHIEWGNLWEPSDKEEAETRKLVAETDTQYVDMGIPPIFIAKSRFGGPKYSMETRVPDAWFKDQEEQLQRQAVIRTAKRRTGPTSSETPEAPAPTQSTAPTSPTETEPPIK